MFSRMPSQVNSSVAVSIADSDIQSPSAPRVQGQVTGKPHGRLNSCTAPALRQTVRGAVRHRHCRIEQKIQRLGSCSVPRPSARGESCRPPASYPAYPPLSLRTAGADNRSLPCHTWYRQRSCRGGTAPTAGWASHIRQADSASRAARQKLPPRGQMPSYSGNYTVSPPRQFNAPILRIQRSAEQDNLPAYDSDNNCPQLLRQRLRRHRARCSQRSPARTV